jgi:predicted glycoside hydrolase/deacetylase ChbG (UPF0249 family)
MDRPRRRFDSCRGGHLSAQSIVGLREPTMTPVIFSVDDFGYHAGVDDAVLDLASRGRITATSCMTAGPRWREAARQLTPTVRARLDVGLHLDFTEFEGIRLSTLIIRSHLRRLDQNWIRARIATQLDAFEHAIGAPPDYVDGHQHIHQLPQIRTELLQQLRLRYPSRMPWLRISRPPAGQGLKGAIIGALGSKQFAREAVQLGFRCSNRLLGSYAFDASPTQYSEHLHAWLAAAQSFDALMLHPASSAPSDDPIGRARMVEYRVLAGDALPELLNTLRIQAVRGQELRNGKSTREAATP